MVCECAQVIHTYQQLFTQARGQKKDNVYKYCQQYQQDGIP
jgi:hypothetical protein